MIHFFSTIQNRALEIIKEAHDCADIFQDLERIKEAKVNLSTIYADVSAANRLDCELRQKYPTIDRMLYLANTMLPPSSQAPQTFSAEERVLSNLTQDYCGILCDTAVKKGLAQSIKDCIEFVD